MSLKKSESERSLAKASTEGGKQKKGANIEKVDYSQPVIVKNSKITFGEKLQVAREQHQDVLEDLIVEMEEVKRDNDRLRRQQEDTFGITMDTVERMKHELERARTTRMFLLEDIENRKQKCEKMEADMFELNMKLESFTKKINEYRRMQGEWEDTTDKLSRTVERCDKLARINKNMKMLLIKHHIDPKTVEFDSGKSRRSDQSTRSHSLRPILKSGEKKANNDKKGRNGKAKNGQSHDTHSFTHVNNSVKKLSRSLEDISSVEETDNAVEIKKKMALTNRKALGRGPPAYLGYYTNIHQNRKQTQNKLKGISTNEMLHLPRIAAVS